MLFDGGKVLVLVTGGAGYIGSHACIELIQTGYEILVLDNFSNSTLSSLKQVEKIVGKSIEFVEGDIRDQTLLESLFAQYDFDAVIHFAGLKSVGESVEKPMKYYDNNVCGSITLFKVMDMFGCKKLVFSSSATVYGEPESLPIRESFALTATNPYGDTKLVIENILRFMHRADSSWKLALLRYFNPVGAHESGLIGENPSGIPNNLMPYIAQVAVGKIDKLKIFGGDYPTHDGTGVRDYIHVVDLVRGHLKALQALNSNPGILTVNLGTGKGYSVMELLQSFEIASGRSVPYEIVDRRSGDVAICYADTALSFNLLGWRAEYGIDRMCEDSWRWQKNVESVKDSE